MENARKINISDFIDNSKIGAFQVGLFTLCAMGLIIDGFDVQALGYVGPAVIEEMGMDTRQLGNVLAATNFGVLLGSLLFTMVGDEWGRRPVLIGATFFFGMMTILAGLSTTYQQLLVIRFIGGIGMGTVIPNATALIAEYSPRRMRVKLIMNITVGFTAGAALGGFVAARMIPTLGWRSVFYFGGAIPLLIGALMILYLPESLQFQVLKKGSLEGVRQSLKRIDPAAWVDANTDVIVAEERKEGVPLRHLFSEGRTLITILYWIVNFTNLLNLFFLAGLLPTVLAGVGHSVSTSALVGGILQLGGVIGTFDLAWMITKKGFTPVLTISFAVGCATIALIGSQPVLSIIPLLTVIVFVSGWSVIGGQPGLNTLAATHFYPTYMRSTGVGWGLGIGRLGAIVGPIVGGQLMFQQLPNQTLFLIFAVPALISKLVMLALYFVMKPQAADAQSEAMVS